MDTIKTTATKTLPSKDALTTKRYMKKSLVEHNPRSDSVALPEELSPGILEALSQTPPITQEDVADIAAFHHALNLNADFQTDLLSGYFLDSVLAVMREDGVKGIELARRLGKSRQYLSSLLDENNRRNFTLSTIAEIAIALNRRVMPLELYNPIHQMKFVMPEEQSFTVSVMPYANKKQDIEKAYELISQEVGQIKPPSIAA